MSDIPLNKCGDRDKQGQRGFVTKRSLILARINDESDISMPPDRIANSQAANSARTYKTRRTLSYFYKKTRASNGAIENQESK